MSARHARALAILSIAVACTLAYLNSFTAPFELDDQDSIVANDRVRIEEVSWRSLREAAFSPPYHRRPVANVTLAVNHAACGLDVRGYHHVNLAIHIVAAVGLLVFLELLLALPGAADPSPGENASTHATPLMVAWAAALWWSLEPVQTQSVTYVTQRMTSLAGLFYFWGLAFYLLGRRGTGRARWGWFALAGSAFLLALGTKEVSATFPAAVLLVEFLFLGRGPGAVRRLGRLALLFLVATVAAGTIAVGGVDQALSLLEPIASGEDMPGRHFTALERVMTEVRIVLWYLTLVFLPHPGRLNLEHDVEVSTSLFSPPATAAAFLAIGVLFYLAVRWRRRFPLGSFAILWYGLHLAIQSSVVGLELVFEHRLYVPSAGPILLAAWLLGHRSEFSPRVRLATVLMVGALLGWGTHARNEVWGSRIDLAADCVAKSPKKPRAHGNLGVALYEEAVRRYRGGDTKAAARFAEEALARHLRALELSSERRIPVSGAFLENLDDLMDLLAVLEMERGRGEEGVALFEMAVALAPRRASLHRNLGVAQLSLGRHELAVESFERAVRLAPGDSRTRFHLARASLLAGDAPRALREIDGCLSRDPALAAGHLVRGDALLALGRLDEADLAYASALALEQGSLGAQMGLGAVLEAKGRAPEAALRYEAILAVDPAIAEAHCRLSRVLQDPAKAKAHAAEALRLDPGHVHGPELRQRLGGTR